MELLSWASALGFLVGMRHAIEPDHIAAVSTIIHGEGSFRRTARVGLAWGLGHSLALLLAGGSLLALRLELPGSLSLAAEICVGVVLIALGVSSLRRALRDGRHGGSRLHAHGPAVHAHPGEIPHVHFGPLALASRPLFLGLLHGLAGTGALAAMILAGMPDLGSGLIYIAVFSAGSLAGMTMLAGLLGKALQGLARSGRARVACQGLAGALSLAVGVAWVWVSAAWIAGP